jgi:glucose-1-phosphate thymidylyltransferase
VKGIVLAGGTGTRLHPITHAVSKQLLPVYDKPMIYYPISALMLAGIRELLIITTPHDQDQFTRLLGNGSQWGLDLSYAVQPSPDGLAQAFLIGEQFLDDSPSALVLGDNIFFGHGLPERIAQGATDVETNKGCALFGYRVSDPSRYGVAELDPDGRLIGIEEKPAKPKSRLAVTGLYVYDEHVVEYAEALRPSDRGELEITDLNNTYIAQGSARLFDLGRGAAWLDTGTQDALMQASEFVQVLQHRQGVTIACLEEIAMRQGFITPDEALQAADALGSSSYGTYLRQAALDFLEDGGHAR